MKNKDNYTENELKEVLTGKLQNDRKLALKFNRTVAGIRAKRQRILKEQAPCPTCGGKSR